MTIYLKDGEILTEGGAIAVSEDCCCEGEGGCTDCGGCDTGTVPQEFQLEIDAALAEGNDLGLAGMSGWCDDEDCQDISGTYILTLMECPDIANWNAAGINFLGADTCSWRLLAQDNPNSLPCVTSTFGDDVYFDLEIRVALGDDGDYYLYVRYYWSDTSPTTTGNTSHWIKNIGPTLPNCSTISEALNNTHYIDPGDFMGTPVEHLTDTCFLENISMTATAL